MRLLVVTGLAVTLLGGCTSKSTTSSDPTPSSGVPASVAADSPTGTSSLLGGSRVVADVGPALALPLLPEFASSAGNSIWYSDSEAGKVARLDLALGKVENPIVIDDPANSPYGSPKTIAADPTGAWLADPSRHSLDRLDRATNRVTRRIALTPAAASGQRPITPWGLAVSGHTAWVTDFDQGLLTEVDTTTGRITRSLNVRDPLGVTLGFGALWVVQHREGRITRVDLTSWTATAVITLPGEGSSSICGMCVDEVVAGPTALWVPLNLGKAVVRINPATNTVTADTPIGLVDDWLAVNAAGVWVAGSDGSIPCTDTNAVLERLNPISGSPDARLVIACAYNPTIAGSSGTVWLAIADNPNAVRRITPHT